MLVDPIPVDNLICLNDSSLMYAGVYPNDEIVIAFIPALALGSVPRGLAACLHASDVGRGRAFEVSLTRH